MAADRDQVATAFTEILETLVAATPGCKAAAIMDFEGECVDYTGTLEAFDVKVTAATLQLVVADVAELERSPRVHQLRIRTSGRSLLLRRIHDEYSLVLILQRFGAFAPSERALVECEARFCHEAALETDVRVVWHRVDVSTEASDRRRPRGLRGVSLAGGTGDYVPLEVLGSVVGSPSERGYRVRLRSGAECTLVRETTGVWYADEPVDQLLFVASAHGVF